MLQVLKTWWPHRGFTAQTSEDLGACGLATAGRHRASMSLSCIRITELQRQLPRVDACGCSLGPWLRGWGPTASSCMSRLCAAAAHGSLFSRVLGTGSDRWAEERVTEAVASPLATGACGVPIPVGRRGIAAPASAGEGGTSRRVGCRGHRWQGGSGTVAAMKCQDEGSPSHFSWQGNCVFFLKSSLLFVTCLPPPQQLQQGFDRWQSLTLLLGSPEVTICPMQGMQSARGGWTSFAGNITFVFLNLTLTFFYISQPITEECLVYISC